MSNLIGEEHTRYFVVCAEDIDWLAIDFFTVDEQLAKRYCKTLCLETRGAYVVRELVIETSEQILIYSFQYRAIVKEGVKIHSFWEGGLTSDNKFVICRVDVTPDELLLYSDWYFYEH